MVERLNNASGALSTLKYLQTAGRDPSVADARPNPDIRAQRTREAVGAPQAPPVVRGEAPSLSILALSLGRAQSISDTALAAASEISSHLAAMKATAAAAMSEGMSETQRQSAQGRYNDQMDMLQVFIRNASFDGANLLDGSRSPAGVSFIADVDGAHTATLQGRNFMPGGPVIIAPPASSSLASASASADTHAMLEASIDNVGDQLAEMGAERKRIEAQKGFVGRLAEALAAGVGRMVDTTLEAETALIQSLQVRQALSAQPISIANAAPHMLLPLLRQA